MQKLFYRWRKREEREKKVEEMGDSSVFLYLVTAKTEKQAERNESFDLFSFFCPLAAWSTSAIECE